MPDHPDLPRDIAPLRSFVVALGRLLDTRPDEPRILAEGGELLRRLVARDDWLPDAFAQPHPQHYQQFLLHADSTERFSVVSFVWGPGQQTPIHDHTVWGLIGMLRGAETSQGYRFIGATRMVEYGPPTLIGPGQVEAVGPRIGDVHRVRNAFDDRVSISIHVYGGDIGATQRSTYLADVSGYSPPWTSAVPHDKMAS
jgi:predicted metal-dependent enzyme (double-stranded beta helix superfamily)